MLWAFGEGPLVSVEGLDVKAGKDNGEKCTKVKTCSVLHFRRLSDTLSFLCVFFKVQPCNFVSMAQSNFDDTMMPVR